MHWPSLRAMYIQGHIPGTLNFHHPGGKEQVFTFAMSRDTTTICSITSPASNVLHLRSGLLNKDICSHSGGATIHVDYVAPPFSCVFNSTGLCVQAAMVTNAETGQKEAVACTAFGASYTVRIGNSDNSSTIALLESPKLLTPLTTTTPDPTTNVTASAMDALADALACPISGNINNTQDRFSWGSSIIQYTMLRCISLESNTGCCVDTSFTHGECRS